MNEGTNPAHPAPVDPYPSADAEPDLVDARPAVPASGPPVNGQSTSGGPDGLSVDLRQKYNEVTRGLSPHVTAAAEKTRGAAGKAVGTVKEKIGQNPTIAAAAEKTVGVGEKTVGTIREQVDQHPQIAAAAEKTAATGGRAARSVEQRARRHPGATSGAVAGAALLFLIRRLVRRRRSAGAAKAGD